MEVRNVEEAEDWFSVLLTGLKTQSAVMTLQPGQSSGHEPEAHKESEQALVVLDGEVLELEERER